MAAPTTSAPARGHGDTGASSTDVDPGPDHDGLVDPAAGLLALATAIEQRHAERADRAHRPDHSPRARPAPAFLGPSPQATGQAVPERRRSIVRPLALAALGLVVVALVALVLSDRGDDDPTLVATGADAPADAPEPDAPPSPPGDDPPPGESAPGPSAATAPAAEADPDADPDAAAEPGADDDQDAVPAPGDGSADAEVTTDDLACTADALVDAVGGSIDGRPVAVAGHECDGDFALARFQVTDGPPADVFVTLYRGEGPWDARYTSRSLDCAAIVGQVQGFPAALCDAAL